MQNKENQQKILRGPEGWTVSRFIPEDQNMQFRKGSVVAIKRGWDEEYKRGICLGKSIFIEQWWTPVLWDGEEDPDWFKSAGLVTVKKLRDIQEQ